MFRHWRSIQLKLFGYYCVIISEQNSFESTDAEIKPPPPRDASVVL